MYIVKPVFDTLSLFSSLNGIQLGETLEEINDKTDVYYFRQNELECTLLLVVGQMMLELSRLSPAARESTIEDVLERLKGYGFNDYTYAVICRLITSVNQIPFMIEGDYLEQLHHTSKQLRLTTHKFGPVEEITQQCETVSYFRTLVKQYLILNAVLFQPETFITKDNIHLLFEALYQINNFANADSIYYDGKPLPQFQNLSSLVIKRNEFMEFRFLDDILTQGIFHQRSGITTDDYNCEDTLMALGLLDDEGFVPTDIAFPSFIPDPELMHEAILRDDPEQIYFLLNVVARFMDWNQKLMDTDEWKQRFKIITDALLERIKAN